MVDIIQIVMLGIVASILFVVSKEVNSVFAFFIALVTGVVIIFIVVQQVGVVFQMIEMLGSRAQINGIYLSTILKIIGIAYIVEIGSHITKDAGLSSVAAKIELAGKIAILLLAIPILKAVIEAILSFLPAA